MVTPSPAGVRRPLVVLASARHLTPSVCCGSGDRQPASPYTVSINHDDAAGNVRFGQRCKDLSQSLAYPSLRPVAVAEKNQEWTRAMDLALRILHEDQFREDIHCLLMRAQAALGNRVAVKEQYETLRGLLQKELGVEPARQTQKTYRELVGTDVR